MMSVEDHEDKCAWGSRSLYLLVLVNVTTGTSIFTRLVTVALAKGVTGHIIGYLAAFVFLGIPMLYLEIVVSQFTTRNCMDVWKARACLSHIGYFQLLWQIFFVIYNHIVTSFVIHYFLISFEDPIPYYECGNWATADCNIEMINYTVNQDCIKERNVYYKYCNNLHSTYPEIQYWLYFILGVDKNYYYVAWRVCLASAIACALVYLSCFRRKVSLRWFIWIFTAFPIVGYFILMICAMMQRGLVQKFEVALDTNFKMFTSSYRVSDIIQHVMYTLGIGSGVAFNLGASTSFRAPCYSNVVITVVVCAAFVLLTIFTVTMMTCPFISEYNNQISILNNMQVSQMFEKLPRIMKEFDHKTVCLILVFSCNAFLGVSASSMITLSLLETFATKIKVVDKYTGLVSFGITVSIFVITMPLLGKSGVYGVFTFRRSVNYMNIFIGMLESLVFVIWYGVDKFSEDVHFMQGIQPKAYMKLAWITSSAVLGYVFIRESYHHLTTTAYDAGVYVFLILVSLMVLITFGKLTVAACRKKFSEAIKLDPMWGPQREVLRRSRAMFSAQAMTKEYMYRQYHLQAGILARQKTANVRRERDIV